MPDIVLRPIVRCAGSKGYVFKVECTDNVLLIDIKKEFAAFLKSKDFRC